MSLLKNSVLIGICLLLSCSGGKQENVSPEKTNAEAAPSFTILTTGMIPPPAYICAEKIVGNEYRISFIPAAGCIVPEKLGDSIERINMKAFEGLKKIYGREMQDEIYDKVQREYTFIHQTDSMLRILPELRKYNSLISGSNVYFDKTNKHYIAKFAVSEPSKEKKGEWTPKLKLLVITDSASKKPLRIIEKDSTLKSLYDLL